MKTNLTFVCIWEISLMVIQHNQLIFLFANFRILIILENLSALTYVYLIMKIIKNFEASIHAKDYN